MRREKVYQTGKKTVFIIGAVLLLAALQMKSALAADVEINETNFPDPAFRAYVSENIDIVTKDGILSDEEQSITDLGVDFQSIESLKGIEYFTSLTKLSCGWNQLSSLDVSKNTALTWLECSYNQLSSLDVSKNTVLTELYCRENKLSSLDVSNNTALTYLSCYSNQLSSLDVSKNTALTYLICHRNQISSLDVSKNTALTELHCYSNQLSSLDVSKNTALKNLYAADNYFSSVDITGLNLSDTDGSREGNLLKFSAKKQTEEGPKTTSKSYKFGEQVSSKTLKAQKGNEAIPENSSFTITAVSPDGKASGTVAFDGVEDENAAAVTIPKTIYIDGVPYDVTTVSLKAFDKSAENAGYKVIDNRIDSLAVEYAGQVSAKKTKKTVSIPEYSNYRGVRFKVTGIAAKSFRKNTKVTKVKIASSITMIGANCFEGCSKLQQVTIGKGLQEIGKNAFKNCKKLTTIQLKGTKLKKVGKAALKGVNVKCKIKVPKARVKAYTKLFKGKGQKKTVKVVKA